ncbi:hypothetical protein HYFRA_00002414 [Hymenoscyphus fraxineus]|uniref:Uncharacterized protein n=1 Tax=Hymenoscyphus fraxineus TaxID=746836 RepID=A0A9N9Q0L6_9HELO|nr:hypothetical protein HYFRA_00002414 [Hymenoscyphus fraxineus]
MDSSSAMGLTDENDLGRMQSQERCRVTRAWTKVQTPQIAVQISRNGYSVPAAGSNGLDGQMKLPLICEINQLPELKET